MAPPLPGPLAHLAPLLDQYGYVAVGVLIFMEDFGLPAPGETILLTAAIYAGAGQLNVVVIMVVAVLAAVAGDNLGYLIGHLGGRPFIRRWGHYVLLPPERFQKVERFFDRHGGKVVAVARFIPGLREANGIVAGTIGMPWLRFLAFNTLGVTLVGRGVDGAGIHRRHLHRRDLRRDRPLLHLPAHRPGRPGRRADRPAPAAAPPRPLMSTPDDHPRKRDDRDT
ncbi:DedA family protein [Streptosporangium canum]|uniref:DedA family protein n=1 Tax=Streptosporangium canum TaxID=324952 RepID=UPI00341E8F84